MEPKIDWEAFEDIFTEALELAKKKNGDYGTQTLMEFGTTGCLIRLSDKLNRLKTLINNQQVPNIPTERIEDTCKDIINYTAYLLLMDQNRLINHRR